MKENESVKKFVMRPLLKIIHFLACYSIRACENGAVFILYIVSPGPVGRIV